jgi:hypothetical protein
MEIEIHIPKLYETESVPLEEKVIHQAYAIPSIGFYWLIAEIDEKENIAFGFANLNDDINAEWGYIPIDEVMENGGELTQDWKPCEYPEARRLIEEQIAEAGSDG